jgi:hypothetical protein
VLNFVANVNGTLVEDKMRRFKDECAHFSCNMCPIYTLDGASTKVLALTHTSGSVATLSGHNAKRRLTEIKL